MSVDTGQGNAEPPPLIVGVAVIVCPARKIDCFRLPGE